MTAAIVFGAWLGLLLPVAGLLLVGAGGWLAVSRGWFTEKAS